MEEVKHKRGRPPSGLTKNELSQRSKIKHETKNITINGEELLKRFLDYKKLESGSIGFEINNSQFLAVLLNTWIRSKAQNATEDES